VNTTKVRSIAAPLAMVAASVVILAAGPAAAHGLAGKRFFPATLATDDPFVADELSLPTLESRKMPARRRGNARHRRGRRFRRPPTIGPGSSDGGTAPMGATRSGLTFGGSIGVRTRRRDPVGGHRRDIGNSGKGGVPNPNADPGAVLRKGFGICPNR
jgi:hypothetical protein